MRVAGTGASLTARDPRSPQAEAPFRVPPGAAYCAGSAAPPDLPTGGFAAVVFRLSAPRAVLDVPGVAVPRSRRHCRAEGSPRRGGEFQAPSALTGRPVPARTRAVRVIWTARSSRTSPASSARSAKQSQAQSVLGNAQGLPNTSNNSASPPFRSDLTACCVLMVAPLNRRTRHRYSSRAASLSGRACRFARVTVTSSMSARCFRGSVNGSLCA